MSTVGSVKTCGVCSSPSSTYALGAGSGKVLDWVIDECLRREAAERTAEGTSTAD
jgi:hypothetical protein